MDNIVYKSGYKYQLCETYTGVTGIVGYDIGTEYIDMDPDGRILIKHGYAWDGPSGPTIDTKNFMRGSLIHDALYQLMREGHLPQEYRDDADEALRRACIEDGMSSIRAWWVYRGVRVFGGSSASTKHDRTVITAP